MLTIGDMSRGTPASGVAPEATPGTRTMDAGEAQARVRAALIEYFPAMWRLLRRLRVPPDAVEDAVQEVFLAALGRSADIRPGSERSFLYGVALRVAAKARSARARLTVEEPVDVADSAPLPDALADRRRAAERLDRALDAMTSELRVAFVLFEVEGLTLPEIATITEVPLGTATSRLRRAREVFHTEVARFGRAPRSGGAR